MYCFLHHRHHRDRSEFGPQCVSRRDFIRAAGGGLAAGGLFGIGDLTSVADAANPSVNRFNGPQCTWAVDNLTNRNGWRLTFSRNSGRDAHLWWDLVTNGTKTSTPTAGAVMVFAATGSGALRLGHVGRVASTTRDNRGNVRWWLDHSNWQSGQEIERFDGFPIRRVEFEFVPGQRARVRIVGSGVGLAIKGFLTKR